MAEAGLLDKSLAAEELKAAINKGDGNMGQGVTV
jgi:hypothetical protein